MGPRARHFFSLDNDQEVERFCNRVAAEFLVPTSHFLTDWKTYVPVEDNLYSLVRRFRVSAMVILRRALDLGKIDHGTFFDYYEREIKKKKERQENQNSGGDFNRSLLARNSKPMVEAIVTATREGKLLYREAAHLLDVRVKTVENLSKEWGK